MYQRKEIRYPDSASSHLIKWNTNAIRSETANPPNFVEWIFRRGVVLAAASTHKLIYLRDWIRLYNFPKESHKSVCVCV
jgi:hypothetical protein